LDTNIAVQGFVFHKLQAELDPLKAIPLLVSFKCPPLEANPCKKKWFFKGYAIFDICLKYAISREKVRENRYKSS